MKALINWSYAIERKCFLSMSKFGKSLTVGLIVTLAPAILFLLLSCCFLTMKCCLDNSACCSILTIILIWHRQLQKCCKKSHYILFSSVSWHFSSEPIEPLLHKPLLPFPLEVFEFSQAHLSCFCGAHWVWLVRVWSWNKQRFEISVELNWWKTRSWFLFLLFIDQLQCTR